MRIVSIRMASSVWRPAQKTTQDGKAGREGWKIRGTKKIAVLLTAPQPNTGPPGRVLASNTPNHRGSDPQEDKPMRAMLLSGFALLAAVTALSSAPAKADPLQAGGV